MSVKMVERIDVLGSVTLAFLFAISGAFSSLAIGSFVLRFVFWLAAIAPLWVGMTVLTRFTLARLVDAGRSLTCLVLVLTSSFASLGAAVYFHLLWQAALDRHVNYVELFTSILPITLVISLIVTFSRRPEIDAPQASGAGGCHLVVEQLRAKMPVTLRGRIASLHAEDHYVRIYAEDGDCLVLMRFEDAVNMMPVEAGFKVHRSHWVSLASLVEIQRIDNRNFGVMADGRLVPISRNHVAHVHRHLANQKLNRS